MEETINYQDYINREFIWDGKVLVCKVIYELDNGIVKVAVDNNETLISFSLIKNWIKKTYL